MDVSVPAAPRRKRWIAVSVLVVATIVLASAAVGEWLLFRPDDQEIAQRALYGQVGVGPDGVRIDVGSPWFGAFKQQVAVFVVRRDEGGPSVIVPAGFRDVTADDREAPAVVTYGMFASYTGLVNGVRCSVSAFPAERRVPGLLGNVHIDPATHQVIALELLC